MTTTWLDELDAAAEHAIAICETGTGEAISDAHAEVFDMIGPERIRALIACVRAAQKLRKMMPHYGHYEFDAARAALDQL